MSRALVGWFIYFRISLSQMVVVASEITVPYSDNNFYTMVLETFTQPFLLLSSLPYTPSPPCNVHNFVQLHSLVST